MAKSLKKSDPLPPAKKPNGRPPVSVRTPLTRKQELFVKEIVSKDGQITLRDAAINAGFAKGSAHSRAFEMTNPHICPHVVAEIKRYRNELDEKYAVTYQRHLRDLQVIRDLALESGAFSAAVAAEHRRGQANGDIYVSKSEIRTGSIDSMTKEEVQKALQELKEQYEPTNIIDITPDVENTQDSTEAREPVLSTAKGGSKKAKQKAVAN